MILSTEIWRCGQWLGHTEPCKSLSKEWWKGKVWSKQTVSRSNMFFEKVALCAMWIGDQRGVKVDMERLVSRLFQ